MKRICIVFFAAVVAALTMVQAQNAKPQVIPEIKEWKGATGTFTVSNSTRIVETSDGVAAVAAALKDDWQTLIGQRLSATKGKAQAGDIVLKIVPDKKQKRSKTDVARHLSSTEGYTIVIGDKVEITACNATGLYWATRTLLQMADKGQWSMSNSQSVSLPCGSINDCPDFEVRGFMLDCGRKFIPMRYLENLVRIMGYYKMNTLQIHLSDNGMRGTFENDWDRTYAAFRMECDTYPGLAARDGYYTKDEFRALQRLALRCGVEIIPEIDAPAHSLAFTRYKPELGSERFGRDHLDITNPETVPFLDALWKEYLEGDDPVFIGPKVHIGTDEYNNSDQAVVEKFRELTDHLIRYVESYGKQACLWGSLTHCNGKTPVKVDNVIMSLWYNGYAKPDSMLNLGYKGISVPDGLIYIVPKAGYYYDYLNIEKLYKEWTPNIVRQKVFDYDDQRIMGGMFAVWNDICGNGVSVKDIHHRIYPAMQTLSAKFWTGKNTTLSFEEFDALRHKLSEAPGVNEMGRLPDTPISVDKVLPRQQDFGAKIGVVEAGYNYSVSFHLKAAKEEKGTILFSSPNAVFYLADPITGSFGYERDGYLYTFVFAPYDGEEMDVTVEGDNKETRLKINGKTLERKYGRTYAKDKMTSETLFFPLQSTGDFCSIVTNLSVKSIP